MKLEPFTAQGETFAEKLPPDKNLCSYFRVHVSRLHQSCQRFNLFSAPLGDVLEIGPFYGFLPLILRPQASSYTVLEGPDPAVYPLTSLYEQHDITLQYLDFLDLFGPTRQATHRLPLTDASYDTILCWDTMEHFPFNPVKFVRELHRVLKPGGRVCVTVPNRASFQNMFALLFGRGEKTHIDSFYAFENYKVDGKNGFLGFHWHEYSPQELARLFTRAGFKVKSCRSFTTFQQNGRAGVARRLIRNINELCASIAPRYGTHICLEATR